MTRERIIQKTLTRKYFEFNSNISKAYYVHAVKYGDYIDVRTYNNVKITFNGKDRNNIQRTGTDKRADSLSRARNNIYRIIHANCFKHGEYKPVFTTYTFAEPISDLTQANQIFKLFIKRLEYHLKQKLQYLTVPEIQKEREKKYKVGVWHFHTIFFNLPWIDAREHEAIWSFGWCDIQTIRDIRDIGAYVAKYLSKDVMESRLYGKKTFYTTRGLIRPVEFFHKEEVDNILKNGSVMIGRYEGNSYVECKYKLV